MTVENLETKKVEAKKQETTTPTTTPTEKTASTTALALKEPGGFLYNRPVEASHLNIVGTYTSVGSIRPVVSSGLKFNNMIAISGNRPIGASSLIISETYKVMGNRPVASNFIDDPASLMGFLD